MLITRGLGSNLLITCGYGGVLSGVWYDPFCPATSPYSRIASFATDALSPFIKQQPDIAATPTPLTPLSSIFQLSEAFEEPVASPFSEGAAIGTEMTDPISENDPFTKRPPKSC